jgi:hypothetical protein
VRKGGIAHVSPETLGGFDAKQNQGGTLLHHREIHLSSNFISSIKFDASWYQGCDSINDCASADLSLYRDWFIFSRDDFVLGLIAANLEHFHVDDK